jgi:hypothetical protein
VGDLDFFVDLMMTDTVLGVDHTSDLADVEEALGRGVLGAHIEDGAHCGVGPRRV